MASHPPIIGVTPAFDDGTDLDSLRPHVSLQFLDSCYMDMLMSAGAVCVLLPLTDSAEAIQCYLQNVNGLLVSGGGGYLRRRHRRQSILPSLEEISPRRYRFESQLIAAALELDMPMLGICRGHQMIAHHFGASHISLPMTNGRCPHYVDRPPVGRYPVHGIELLPGSRLQAWLGGGRYKVNSLHRQAIDQLAAPLVATAWADDGTVEALESVRHRFVIGVQFHPELLAHQDSSWMRLFDAFLQEAVTFRSVRDASYLIRKVGGEGALTIEEAMR